MKAVFPEDLRPERCPIYTCNEIEFAAGPETVWAWLIRAESWHTWYPNCKNLKFLTGEPPNLAPETIFSWVTFGVRVKTRVHDFEPYKVLSWRGEGLGAKGFHAWVIEPTSSGCRVITEEVQSGFFPMVGKAILKRGLLKYHQIWLEGLAKMAETGPP